MPETAAKQIKPFWGRVSLIESPVEETVVHSGIVVPSKFEGDDGIKRGIVVGIDLAGDLLGGPALAELEIGTVVFYRGGVKLPGGVIIVEARDIYAYESS
jgi:co-chaperonin GroES (HSP10)